MISDTTYCFTHIYLQKKEFHLFFFFFFFGRGGGGGSTNLQDRQVNEDRRIARFTATELVAAIRDGNIPAERVVRAFSQRARSIGSLKLRAVTEEFYDEAVATAAAIDRNRQAEGNNDTGDERVLEGVPVSIKEHIRMKGAVRVVWIPH